MTAQHADGRMLGADVPYALDTCLQNRTGAPAMSLPAGTLPNSGVPEVVVDVFDPVQVDQQQPDRGRDPAGGRGRQCSAWSNRSSSSAVRVACSALAMSSRARGRLLPLPGLGRRAPMHQGGMVAAHVLVVLLSCTFAGQKQNRRSRIAATLIVSPGAWRRRAILRRRGGWRGGAGAQPGRSAGRAGAR